MALVSRPPADEYRDRLALRHGRLKTLTVVDARYSAARLVVFGAAVILFVMWWRGALSAWWLAVPAAAFLVLIRRHDVVIRTREATARAIAFYERGLARIEDRWAGTGESGDRFRDEHHLYANDVDLFGDGSLFQLLSVARTRAGEETLARWLTTRAGIDEIRSRHGAVHELTPGLDLREAMTLAGTDVRAGVDGDAHVAWTRAPRLLKPGWLRGAAALLTVLAVATAAYSIATSNSAPFVAVVAAEILFSLPQRRRVDQALHAADGPARDLDILAHALARLENERFTAPQLVALVHSLQTDGLRASVAIRRLDRLVELHDWQHNLVFAPIGAALLWGTHLAWAIEHWRERHGASVETWLRTVGEFEALSSIAAYRYEHPDDPFPQVIEGPAPAAFDGAALGHPLIPAARMVRNDVRLSSPVRLLVVSGSNMSGKSTLLRTVGINTVLAMAGAPVRAASLRLTPLAVGATLRIQDSLQEGRSRFYAEITRVRALADLTGGPVPLLFLLDELFQGTNSHDRVIGAAGVLRSLIDRGGIGLITTHDLALTSVAADLAPRGENVHFEDRFEGGELRFDYRMKPGPVTRSNAIALMRAVGLDVDTDASGTKLQVDTSGTNP
jgi:hypothetical protein